MNSPNVSTIKRSQKESLILQELSKMVLQLSLDDRELLGLFINRVEFTKNKGAVLIYFYDAQGPATFEAKKRQLILYKPSMRKSIATIMNGRYTPELIFAFDSQFDRQQRIEGILDHVKKDFKKE